MLAFVVAAAATAQSPVQSAPPPPIVKWDSPDFLSALDKDRQSTDAETVSILVVTRLQTAAWHVCPLGGQQEEEWKKRMHLSDAEKIVFETACATYLVGQREEAQAFKKLVNER